MSELTIPYLPEHAAPDNPGGGTPGYNPSADDKKILQLVDSLYSRAKKYRKRYDQKWIDFYKMFRGRQWKEVRPAYRHSEVLNLVFETIQSMVPILTDSRPKLEFLPTVPSQFEVADILTKVASNDWEHNNWLYTLTEIIYDAHFYGTGFGYVGFNPKAEMGLGSIEFESQDVFYAFPDPQARDVNGKRTKHFITAEPVDISQLKKEYADKPNSKYIAADIIDFQQGDKADIYQVMFKSPTDSKLIVEGPSGYDSIAKNQTLKITIYSKDDDFDEEAQIELGEDGTPKLDENGEPQKKFIQKLKYPTGRKIVVAGGVVLEDGPLIFEDGQFPFVKLTNYILPREFWGVGDVENLDSPQKTINKIISFTLDIMTLMGNPIWIVDDAAGIDTDNIFNKPGLIIEKAAGTEVRRESGVELPGYVLPLLDRYRRYFDGISGQTDLSRGVEPGNVTAASAIEDLQQAQQTRLRQKTRNIDAFLQDFGKLYVSRVFQFYSVPRIVRVTGDTNADQYFYFHVEKLEGQDEQGNPITRRFANITSHDGEAKRIEIIGDFDIRVSTGSTLPFAKEAKGQMSLNLFKMGIIDEEEVLKSLDYPNYEAVLQRVHMKKAQAQQQQLQAAGQMAAAKVAETQSKAMKNQADAAHSAIDTAVIAQHSGVQLPTGPA
jgi:hypothetical protein